MEFEEDRIQDLDTAIEELFGHLAEDEIEIAAGQFEKRETLLVEISKTGKRTCHVRCAMSDIEFKPVLFPDEIAPLIQPQDVFLVTMGKRDGKWHVIWMSPRYEEEIIFDGPEN